MRADKQAKTQKSNEQKRKQANTKPRNQSKKQTSKHKQTNKLKVISYYQLSWWRELATAKSFKALKLVAVANSRYQLSW